MEDRCPDTTTREGESDLSYLRLGRAVGHRRIVLFDSVSQPNGHDIFVSFCEERLEVITFSLSV